MTMRFITHFFKIYKYPVFSGVMFGCNFIPLPGMVLLFALVPLWSFILEQNRFKRVFVGCFLCQIITTVIACNWIIYTFHYFGGMNLFFSVILFILFCCCVGALYIVLSGGVWFFLTTKIPLHMPLSVKLVLLPLVFSFLHNITPTLFPWNMGYPFFWGGLPVAQTAELWGFRFLDMLFYIFNLLFLIAFKYGFKDNPFFLLQLKDKSVDLANKSIFRFFKRACYVKGMFFYILYGFNSTGKKTLLVVLSLFVTLSVLGLYLKQRLPDPDQYVNAIVVQNNMGASHSAGYSLYVSKNLTYRAHHKYVRLKNNPAHFILWPEGGYNYTISKEASTEKNLSEIALTLKTPIITGAFASYKGEVSNSVFVFDRKGRILKPIYDKIKLVIFGEYFPLIDRFGFLRAMFPYFHKSLKAGTTVLTQQLEGVNYGWQLCYEVLFDNISRTLAHQGTQIFVNLTNDSWYGSWQEPLQHMYVAFSRSIEFRRPLIRATNTGYSGLVHVDGTVDQISPFNKPWFYFYRVPYYKNPPKTLFMSWGYYIREMLWFLMLVCCVVCVFYSTVKEKNTS